MGKKQTNKKHNKKMTMYGYIRIFIFMFDIIKQPEPISPKLCYFQIDIWTYTDLLDFM